MRGGRAKPRAAANKGFTLVEVIVVLVVLAVLAGVTYGTMKTFISRAEQTAREQNARTLFMASQSALTHLYANDPDGAAALSASAAPVTLDTIKPQPDNDEWTLEYAENKENIVSLSSNGGAGTALLNLIGPYVDDKIVLGNNILIEFNKVTGNVLACFYSDETALSHGTAGYNVYQRSESALKAGLVGGYCVSYTGTSAARQVVEEAAEEPQQLSVWLVDYDGAETSGNNINGGKNYGLLALECALPEDAPADTVYSVSISSSNGKNWYLTLGPNTATAAVQINSLGTNLTNALNSPLGYQLGGGSGQGQDNRERHAAVFCNPQPCADGRKLIVIVLDSQVSGADIATLYPDIASGYLVATLAGESESTGTVYDTVTSNYEHALYADLNEAGTAYVASVRHLNNVRSTMNGKFEQTRNITMLDYTGGAYAMPAIGYGASSAGKRAFTGAYNGKDYEIAGLTMPSNTQNAGLFYTIGGGGRVEHVKLTDCDLSGTSLAGGIAATNNGTVDHCTVYCKPTATGAQYFVVATGDSGVAGGIAAVNTGTIQSCYVGAGVKAVSKAGGVAGVSSGDVAYCEVATALSASVSGTAGTLCGTPYFGAKAGASSYYGENEGVYAMDNNQRRVLATAAPNIDKKYFATSGIAGGIVGEQTGGQISYCTNAASVGADKGVAGGVVGALYLDDTSAIGVTMSYNAGVVRATTYAGGVVGHINGGAVSLCYNTAPVNCFITTLQILNGCFMPADTVHATENAGGIAGRVQKNSSVTLCYSASYVCAGDNTAYAGAFGSAATDSSVKISNCYILRNAINFSAKYPGFSGSAYVHYQNGEATVRVLDRAAMEKAVINSALCVRLDSNGGNPGVGPYFKFNAGMSGTKPYYFPVFSVNTSICALGTGFQRTPYYPVVQELGRIVPDNTDSDDFIVTCYVQGGEATVKLVINVGVYIKRDYTFTLSQKIGSDETSASGLTMTGTGYLLPTITLSGITGTAVPLNAGDDLYALGYTQKYVLRIPRSQALLDWYPNTVTGTLTGATAGTTLMWDESSEKNWN